MKKMIMFLDESGDARLDCSKVVDEVLCIPGVVVFEDQYYSEIIPAFENLKIKYFGTKDVVFHGEELRYKKNLFNFFNYDQIKAENFNSDLDDLLRDLPYSIIASYIDKKKHCAKYIYPDMPYPLALKFILERFSDAIYENRCDQGYILAESRGSRPDQELKLQVENMLKYGTNFYNSMNTITSIRFIPKHENIIGLQISDLLANPLMRKIKYPERYNPPYELFKEHIKCSGYYGKDRVLGVGIKIFPKDSNYTEEVFK